VLVGQEARSGLRAKRASLRQGQFSGAQNLESNAIGSLLLLADNYFQQLRTKPQRHEGTKDAQRYDAFYCFAILAGLWAAAPGSRSTVIAASARVPAAARGSPPVDRAVWDCGAVVRAGRRPVGPENQVAHASGKGNFPDTGLGKQCLRFAITIK